MSDRIRSVNVEFAETQTSTTHLIQSYLEIPETLRYLWRRWYAHVFTVAEDLSAQSFNLEEGKPGYSVEQVAAVIAITSQDNRWEMNMRNARYHLGLGEEGDGPHKYKDVRVKVQRVLEGVNPWEVVSGPKITAFYSAILEQGKGASVVVDRWAVRAAVPQWDTVLHSEAKITKAAYVQLAQLYRQAAAQVGVPVQEFQAAVWVAARGGEMW